MDRRRIPAVAAQFTQALTSLVFGMVAVRALDPTGFGQYSLVISTLVVMTGATTGLVGDTLTVLDRHHPPIRSALQHLALGSALVGGLVVAFVGIVLGWFPNATAPIVAVAVLSFLFEDVLRRMLMANSRFVSVLWVDLSYAAAAALTLWVIWSVSTVTLGMIFVAMTVGQCVAAVVAVNLLPAEERYLVMSRGAAWRETLGFGSWRAIQGLVGPARLWGARALVAAFATLASVGVLEANRLVVAPIQLAVQGMASAILVAYVTRARTEPWRLNRAADRDALLLVGGALAGTAILVAAAPLVGRILLGSTELVNRPAMLGWGLVAVGAGAAIPYMHVSSVLGAPGAAASVRILDMVLSLAAVGTLMLTTTADESYIYVPAVLGLVVCSTALLQRARSRARVAAVGHEPYRPTSKPAPEAADE